MDRRKSRQSIGLLTQTHALLALAIWAKPKETARNWSVLAGALATDIFIYIGFIWFVGIKGQTASVYFADTYFEGSMQFWSALSNSLPLFAVLAVIGLTFKTKKWGMLLLVFALAGFSQSAIDLPVHADDAHRHFWPLSNLRFFSPISYWDPDHYGRIVGPFDMALGLTCIAILWRRFNRPWVKVVLGFWAALYVIALGAALISAL